MTTILPSQTSRDLNQPSFFRIVLIFLFVFLSGFANLATQIIGPRMFSSFLGASTLVWASMISVTLVGLSLGYFWGGRLPLDRAKRVLPFILVFNAVYLIVISFLVWQIPVQLSNFGVASNLLLTFVIFFIPSTLFGMTSPIAITLLSEFFNRRQMSGVAGSVYGIGTVGNVLGALSAAFILIPNVGLSLSLQAFAVMLLVFAAYFRLSYSNMTGKRAALNAETPSSVTGTQGDDFTRDTRSTVLFALVLFSGFASLSTEIIAPRMFVSLFGSTTILWAVMISVTLLGLSIGYFIGGSIPQRAARFVLPFIITVNAFLLLLASWVVWELPNQLGIMGVELVTVSAAAAFLLPSILFGMDTQIVIALLSEGKSKGAVAKIVGTVFSIATIGSFLGALVAALILIPYVGLSSSLQLFALGFILFSLYLFPGGLKVISIAAAIAIFFIPQPDWRWEDNLTLLAQREGYYQTIRIYTDNTSFVRLHLGPTYESEMNINTFEPGFGYARNMVEATGDVSGKTVLVIGGAGHSMARALERRGAIVTEVEIDPVVVEMSNEFFGEIAGEVVVQDGRAYVEQVATDTFDFVLIDAFNGPASVPAQLTTVEFFESVERILKPDGTMVMNFIGQLTGERSGSFTALSATIASAFTDAGYFGSGNILFVASETELEGFNVTDAPPDGQVLTDDLNPIEILLEDARGGFRYRR